MKKHRVLRFIGGFPLPAKLGLKADSVQEAIKDLGQHGALASLDIDTFRAHFIRRDEAKKILVPVEDALNRKRKAETLG